jgi:protocatechuate 3,4-dioxygenase beta subunit
MISSARQAIACILLILSTILFAQSQTVSDKDSNGSISGKVTVKDKGVSGIVVGLIATGQRSSQTTVQKATTDEEGNYKISNVRPGAYELAVSSLIYVAVGPRVSRKALIVGKGETVENVDFALMRGGVITGKVTDAEGRPVIEINVAVSPAQSDYPLSLRSSLRTDDRGIYRAFGLPPGSYTVSVGEHQHSMFGNSLSRFEQRLTYYPAAADRSQATVLEVTEGSETTGIDMTLGRPMIRYSASGRIVDGETGKPVAGIRYGVQRFLNKEFQQSRSGGVATNEQGEFKLQNLPPGSYAVFAEYHIDTDWRIEPLHFEVVDQDITGLIVKTAKGGSVSGTVVVEEAESAPVVKLENGHVSILVSTGRDVRGINRSTRINADGTFRMGGLASGQLKFWVSTRESLQLIRIERDGVAYPNGIEIKEQEHITGVRIYVGYATGMMRGQVKLANGSAPPENRASVSLKLIDDPINANMRGVQVDSRGQFVYSMTPESSNPRLQKATQQVRVTNGNVSSVTLTLPEQ